MKPHWHTSIDQILLTGIAAIIVIDVLGIVAANMTAADNPTVAKFGVALGAIVPFKG